MSTCNRTEEIHHDATGDPTITVENPDYEPEPDARHTSENLVCEPRQDAALPWSGVKITPSENEVRERIAGEIEADLEDGSSCIQHVYFAEGMRHAAEIARSGR